MGGGGAEVGRLLQVGAQHAKAVLQAALLLLLLLLLLLRVAAKGVNDGDTAGGI